MNSSDSYTAYHPHYTYTFDGLNGSPFDNRQKIDSISSLKVNRPMLADGVMKLYKEDIKTNYFGNKRQLRVEHPYTLGKSGFVVFSIYDMPDSQDTKTMFSAFVILKETGVMNCGSLLNTCKTPYLMYLRSDGYLSEYNGVVRVDQLRKYLKLGDGVCL